MKMSQFLLVKNNHFGGNRTCVKFNTDAEIVFSLLRKERCLMTLQAPRGLVKCVYSGYKSY